MIDAFLDFLRQNDLASGGLVVVLFGSFGYLLRQVPSKLLSALRRRFVLSIEILDSDESFIWISQWLAKHEYAKKSRRLSVLTRPVGRDNNRPVSPAEDIEARMSGNKEISYIPSPGWHLLRAAGMWLVVQRDRSEPRGGNTGSGAAESMFRYEKFSVYAASWNRDKVLRLLQDARDVARPPGDDHVGVYGGAYVRHLCDVPARAIRTVVLDGGIERDVLADVEEFVGSRQWYIDRSIPYRRGYLLHGPPGNGKTSLIMAVASHLQKSVGLVSLTDGEVDDYRLLRLLSEYSKYGMIVVIEDIDEAFDENRKPRCDKQRLTYAGLTNAIDGIASPSGQILFMTTNHRSNLDAALSRPGRVDVEVEVGNATSEQIRRLAEVVLGGEVEQHRGVIDKLLAEDPMSMASVQQTLLVCTGRCGKEFAR